MLEMRVQIPYGTALSVDAKALNNEASVHAYNPSGREVKVHILGGQPAICR